MQSNYKLCIPPTGSPTGTLCQLNSDRQTPGDVLFTNYSLFTIVTAALTAVIVNDQTRLLWAQLSKCDGRCVQDSI